MLKDITLIQYFPGNSPIHNLDPGVKIILVTIYLAVTFMIKNFAGYALVAVFTFAVVLLSRLPIKYVLRGLRPMLFFMSITGIMNIFMSTGDNILLQFGFLKVTWEGLYFSIFTLIRIFFIVVSSSMLTLTTSPTQLTSGLENLMKPLKKFGFPSHEIALMMTIALRFIPTLLDEADKIIKAQSARGANFESGNIIKRTKATIPILVPLFVSAFRHADELALAMECRCYQSGKNRTRLKDSKITKSDLLSIAIILIFVMILFFVN